MHVEAAKARRDENGFWQKQAVGHDNRRIRAVSAECFLRGRILEGFRRMDRERQAPRFALDWCRLQFQTAARRPGRARVDGDNVVPARARSSSVGTAKSGVPMKIRRSDIIRPGVDRLSWPA